MSFDERLNQGVNFADCSSLLWRGIVDGSTEVTMI